MTDKCDGTHCENIATHSMTLEKEYKLCEPHYKHFITKATLSFDKILSETIELMKNDFLYGEDK